MTKGPNWPRSDRIGAPAQASPGYPGWVCKNNCGKTFPENTPLKRCPECTAPLVRWLAYDQK